MHNRPKSDFFLDNKDAFSHSQWLKEKKEHKQTLQQLFKPRNCSQKRLISKLNIYRTFQKSSLLDTFYCHGLTLLWLYKMAEGEAQWFYDVIEKIISCSPLHLREKNKDIDKFIDYIEWGQNSIKYTRHKEACIGQSDVDKILQLTQIEARSKQFSYPELYDFLQKRLYRNEMIVLSCTDKQILHTIGIFVAGPLYFLYDANDPSGRPSIFSTPFSLIQEIKRCMYVEFKKSPPLYYMSLEMHVLNSFEVQAKKLLSKR